MWVDLSVSLICRLICLFWLSFVWSAQCLPRHFSVDSALIIRVFALHSAVLTFQYTDGLLWVLTVETSEHYSLFQTPTSIKTSTRRRSTNTRTTRKIRNGRNQSTAMGTLFVGFLLLLFFFYRCTFLHVVVWFADKTDHSVSAAPPFEELKLKVPEFNWSAFYKTSQGLQWQKTQRQGEGKDEAQRWQHRQIQGQAQGEKEGGEGESKTNHALNIFFPGIMTCVLL